MATIKAKFKVMENSDRTSGRTVRIVSDKVNSDIEATRKKLSLEKDPKKRNDLLTTISQQRVNNTLSVMYDAKELDLSKLSAGSVVTVTIE